MHTVHVYLLYICVYNLHMHIYMYEKTLGSHWQGWTTLIFVPNDRLLPFESWTDLVNEWERAKVGLRPQWNWIFIGAQINFTGKMISPLYEILNKAHNFLIEMTIKTDLSFFERRIIVEVRPNMLLLLNSVTFGQCQVLNWLFPDRSTFLPDWAPATDSSQRENLLGYCLVEQQARVAADFFRCPMPWQLKASPFGLGTKVSPHSN